MGAATVAAPHLFARFSTILAISEAVVEGEAEGVGAGTELAVERLGLRDLLMG